MIETLYLFLACTGGLLLGVLYYGGLWLTVRMGLAGRRPALWFLASYLLRTGTVVAGMYVLSGGLWQRLLVCLLGFLSVRLLMIWFWKKAGSGTSVREAGYAA